MESKLNEMWGGRHEESYNKTKNITHSFQQTGHSEAVAKPGRLNLLYKILNHVSEVHLSVSLQVRQSSRQILHSGVKKGAAFCRLPTGTRFSKRGLKCIHVPISPDVH